MLPSIPLNRASPPFDYAGWSKLRGASWQPRVPRLPLSIRVGRGPAREWINTDIGCISPPEVFGMEWPRRPSGTPRAHRPGQQQRHLADHPRSPGLGTPFSKMMLRTTAVGRSIAAFVRPLRVGCDRSSRRTADVRLAAAPVGGGRACLTCRAAGARAGRAGNVSSALDTGRSRRGHRRS